MIAQMVMELETETKSAYKKLPEHLKKHLDGFLDTLKPSTHIIYKSVLSNFLYKINNGNNLILKQFNLEKWNQFVEQHYTNLESSSVSVKSNAVKSFFRYLVSTGYRGSNPLSEYVPPKRTSSNNRRIELSWDQIQVLKTYPDKIKQGIFEAAYHYKKSIEEVKEQFDLSHATIDLYTKQMGKEIGIEKLKYSDITAAHNRFFRTCPVLGKDLEMIEENWIVKDGLMQAKEDVENERGN